MQDYLAAKEAVERGDFALLLAHAHEPEWEEVIRMAVAHARPDECALLLEGLLAPGPRGMQRNRRRLLAAACLEHVTELDPDVHARIRRETRNIVRPASVAAARGLGWVGPIVLEMLPDPATVDDQEAYRIAVTVTRIQDDAAVDYLARMRDRSSLALRAELARGWRNFDTERYAEEVVRHLDPEGLYFPRLRPGRAGRPGEAGRPPVDPARRPVHPAGAAALAGAGPAHAPVAGLRPGREHGVAGGVPPADDPAGQPPAAPGDRGAGRGADHFLTEASLVPAAGSAHGTRHASELKPWSMMPSAAFILAR